MATFASVNDHAPEHEEEPPQKTTYKSFKKKFLKIRHVFRDRMRESNNLFDEEQRLIKLSQRLQEQNDQLLELLLDVNESSKIPPSLRYNLSSAPPSPSAVPSLSPDSEPPDSNQEIQEAQAALDEARSELRNGQIDEDAYKEIESSLSTIISRSLSLHYLSKTSHSILHGDKSVPLDLLPPEITEASPVGYLAPSHEEEYTAALDTYIDSGLNDDLPLPPRPKPTEREREREAQLHNPMSVYNWLAKNRSDVFIDQPLDEQASTTNNTSTTKEKSSKNKEKDKDNNISSSTGGGSGGRKPSPRTPAVPTRTTDRKRSAVKPDLLIDEVLDEDGFVIGGTGLSDAVDGGRKRKRGKEDEPYRPKGGSSRPSKRKRASTGTRAEKRAEMMDED